ncbi:MAG: MBG domain-containing protein, partial [Clostridiaceae bacterium]|nr:MBG domain-containing protein [Clostridiaceae bacterium]
MGTKKNRTRFLALVLSLAMVIGMMPMSVFATGETVLPDEYAGTVGSHTTEGGISYVLDTDGVDAGGNYLIVAADDDYALYHSGTSIRAQSVTIDDNIAEISGNESTAVWAFSGSTSSTIQNGSSGLCRQHGSTILSIRTSDFTSWAVSPNGTTGSYAISTEKSGQTYYLNYDSSYFNLTSSNANVRLYKQTQMPGETVYTADLTGIQALISEVGNPNLHVDSFSQDLQDAYTSALLAANAAVTGTESGYMTEAAALARQEAIDAAALALYNAYQALLASSVTVTVEYVDEAGNPIAASEEHIFADGAEYSFTAPAIGNYTLPDPATQTGTAAVDTTVIFTYGADLTTAGSKTIEFWITNARVYDHSAYSVAVAASAAYGVNGIDITTLVPETGSSAANGNEVIYWKTVRLDASHHQTGGGDDDETASGTEFQYVRYYSGVWQYSADRSGWTNIQSGDQLVAYYLENTQLTQEVQVSMKDWGFKYGQTWGSYPPYCAIAYQVVYEDGTVAPMDARTAAMVFYYNHNRPIGVLMLSENGDYDIWKVTSTTGLFSYHSSEKDLASSYFTFGWNNDETTRWTGDLDGSLVIDSTQDPYTALKWHSANSAILIKIYVKAQPTTDSLTVNYFVDGAATPFYNYNINVASGTTFGALGAGPDGSGYYALPDSYSVTNALGVTQTVNPRLDELAEIGDQYNDTSFMFLGATRDTGNKTLNLYYQLNSRYVQFEAGANGSLSGETYFGSIINGTIWGNTGVILPTPVAENGYYFSGWTCTSGDGSLNGIPNATYTVLANLTFTANFTKCATLSATGGAWTYDGAAHAATASVTGGTGYTIYYKVGTGSWSTTAPSVTNVSDGTLTVSVKATKTGSPELTCADVTLAVSAAELTVTAADKSRAYGEANPTLTYTISGFVNNETAATALTGVAALSTTATAASPAGQYPITADVGSLAANHGNYKFEYVSGTLTVSANTTEIRVTAASDSRTY